MRIRESMKHMARSIWTILFVISAITTFAQPEKSLGRASIRPSLVALEPGETQRFKVVLEPRLLRTARLAHSVKWSVNDIPGGSGILGTIDANGLYKAPERVPKPCEIHICAETEEAENHFLCATALLGEPCYRLLRSWGEPAETGTYLRKPQGISLSPGGDLLITDIGVSKVFRFTLAGEFRSEIGLGGGGQDPGHFEQPRDVVEDKKQRIFVSDVRTGPPRIQVFGSDGSFLHGFAQKGVGPGQVMRTHGMQFDPNGRLFVTDIDNMRINLYDSEGSFLESWQGNGENPSTFNAPYGLVLDRNGDVFVPGYYGPCQKFTRDGLFLFAFACADPPDGPVGFQNAAGDRWGNIYLASRSEGESPGDFDKNTGKQIVILKYNGNGDFITRFDLPPGELGDTGMVVDGDGNLHVVFVRTGRVGIEVYAQN